MSTYFDDNLDCNFNNSYRFIYNKCHILPKLRLHNYLYRRDRLPLTFPRNQFPAATFCLRRNNEACRRHRRYETDTASPLACPRPSTHRYVH